MREADLDIHGMVCDFGKHRGELYTRIPVSYLLWMVQAEHSKANIARAELERRGTTMPEIELSAHSVDRASQRCLNIWQETRNGDEGLYSWLARVAFEAYQGGLDEQGRADHMGMRFVYQPGEWPIVKTVQLRKGS